MKKLPLIIASAVFLLLGWIFISLQFNDTPLESLTANFQKVDAVTQEQRKKIYSIIDEVKLEEFINAKTETKLIERQIKYYVDTKEEMSVDDVTREQVKKEATSEVVSMFINQVLSKNGIDQDAFKKEFGNLLKLSVLESLDDQLEPIARKLISIVKAKYNIDLYVYEGMRKPERQEILYRQGRESEGKIVTNAPAYSSPHQFGYAFDIACKKNGVLTWSNCDYMAIGYEGKQLGLIWGGDWSSLQDRPHFELNKKYWSQSAIIKQYVCARKSPLCEDSDLFLEVGKDKGIDPMLLVAIAVADTSLGKSLKTQYNIGNWGNVDHDIYGKSCVGKTTDGCGVHLESWKEGIEKMATATSIRKNDLIGQLSPGCNMEGIYYATSPSGGWLKNVRAVMSELHGTDIDCNYSYKK